MFGGELLSISLSLSAPSALTPSPSPNRIGRGEALERGKQLHGMSVREAGHGANEFEFAIEELLLAKISEAFDEGIFAGHHLGKLEGDVLNTDAPGLGMAGQVHDLGGVEKGLGRHAAAQDAQAADLFAALDHNRFETISC